MLVLQRFREKRSPIERHFATFVPPAATLQPVFATEFATIATSCARGCVGDPFGIGQISRGFRVAVSRYRAESEAFLAGFGGWWLAMRGVTCVRRASTGRVGTDSGLEGWYRRIFSRRRGILCGGGRSWGAFGKDAYTLLINTNVIVRVRGGCVKGDLGSVRFFLKGGETPGGSPVARFFSIAVRTALSWFNKTVRSADPTRIAQGHLVRRGRVSRLAWRFADQAPQQSRADRPSLNSATTPATCRTPVQAAWP